MVINLDKFSTGICIVDTATALRHGHFGFGEGEGVDTIEMTYQGHVGLLKRGLEGLVQHGHTASLRTDIQNRKACRKYFQKTSTGERGAGVECPRFSDEDAEPLHPVLGKETSSPPPLLPHWVGGERSYVQQGG
jgi:hypothetical protein